MKVQMKIFLFHKLELVKSYCEKEIFSFELSYKKNPYEKLPADMS